MGFAALVVASFAPVAAAQCPNPPSSVSISSTCSNITIQWAGTQPGTSGLQLLRSTTGSAANATVIASAAATAVGSITDATAQVGVSYTYFLRAVTAPNFFCSTGLGPVSAALAGSRRTALTVAPTNVVVTGTCAPLLVTFDPVPGAEAYSVYTSTTVTLPPNTIPAGVTSANSVSIPTPAGATGQLYVFVAAANTCGVGPVSAGRLVTLGSTPTQVTRVDAVGEPGCNGVRVSWVPTPDATEYAVLSGPDANNLTYIVTIPSPSNSVVVNMPAGINTLTFRVLSQSPCGQAATGATASFDRTQLVNLSESPQSQAVNSGQSATLSARIANASQIVWKRDGVTISGGGRFSGAASPVLTIQNVSPADAGVYTVEATGCVLTGSGPVVSNSAVLGVRGSSTGGPATCIADADGSGQATLDDVFFFLDRWFAGCP